jgi:membrane-bound metal-dependent hydrolase YbcI (DUF457 family)
MATFAATLGSVFPDVDVVQEAFARDPLAIVKYHRGVTHSFVCLPIFAGLLAWLTRWIARRTGHESPSWAMLTVIYGVGIASHIILDAMTSFGTRIWDPLSQQRVAWDVLFIIDFTLTSIVLLPQVIAWIYRGRQKSLRRAIWMSLIFTLAAFTVWEVTRAAGFPFHLWIAFLASAVMAAAFFLPSLRGWGFSVTRARWCQGGAVVLLAYLLACAAAHHAALLRIANFASANHIFVDRMGAIPLPPSLLEWGGVIRSIDGVYQAHMDLRDAKPPEIQFVSDSPPDAFIARAMRLPEVRLYWRFARFPVIRSSFEDGHHVVDFAEHRFVTRHRESPQPFTYRVVFDAAGNVLAQGWRSNGMLRREMKQKEPRAAGDPR